jgi:molybdenum cofactor guanylyltransferase
VASEGLTGLLLVGGASARFGSQKALARFRGETLAVRSWRTLGEICNERIAVGKRDELELPFELLDDGTEVRAPIAGVVAGLDAARHDLCVILPVDCPLVDAVVLGALVRECAGVDAAVPQTGPLPGAYRRSALPVLQRRLAAERLSLRGALG